MKPYFGQFIAASPYGMRKDPITGEEVWHSGFDLIGLDSLEVRSPVNGTVLRSRMVTDKSNRTWEWGNYVSIAGEDGYTYYLCHLSKRCVEQGETVRAGQVIGIEGSTGRSTGSHLHFEVRDSSGTAVDPAHFLGIPSQVGLLCDGGNLPDPWAVKTINRAIADGVLLGNGEGDLMLEETCSRQDMLLFLYRMMDLMGKEVKE